MVITCHLCALNIGPTQRLLRLKLILAYLMLWWKNKTLTCLLIVMPYAHARWPSSLANYDIVVTQGTLVVVLRLPYMLVMKLLSKNHPRIVPTTSMYMMHHVDHMRNLLKDHNPYHAYLSWTELYGQYALASSV